MKNTRKFCLFFLVVTFLLVFSKQILAQNICGTIKTDPTYNSERNRIELVLTEEINESDLLNAPARSWIIADITEMSVEQPIFVDLPPERGDRRPIGDKRAFIDILLYLNRPPNPNHEYRIFQSKLTFGTCKPKNVLEVPFSGKAATTTVPPTSPTTGQTERNKFLNKFAAKGRDDSNVYLSGNIEGSHRAKTQFSADIKIDQPFASYRFFEEIGPYFNLKASTATKADANAISFGAKFRHTFTVPITLSADGTFKEKDDHRLLSLLVLDFSPGFESDRRGKNINTLLGSRLSFVPRVFGKAGSIYFQPFIGSEVGTNIKSPLAEAENRGVLRAYAGSSLYVNFPNKFKGISFQTDYIRRFLFNRELRFNEDKNGKLSLLDVGRGPRDYLKSGFIFNISDFTGVSINYEYGRQPPNFQLVDSKFSFGLVYKFKTTSPAK